MLNKNGWFWWKSYDCYQPINDIKTNHYASVCHFSRDKLHSLNDLFSQQDIDAFGNYSHYWHQNGLLHRSNGNPAYIRTCKQGQIIKFAFYLNGQKHNLNDYADKIFTDEKAKFKFFLKWG